MSLLSAEKSGQMVKYLIVKNCSDLKTHDFISIIFCFW